METEVKVALIGVLSTSITAITALIGIYLQKKKSLCCKTKTKNIINEESDEENINHNCQILETNLQRDPIFGRILVNENQCHTKKKKCPFCNKYFCEYHIEINNNGALHGGHICNPSNP